MSPGAATAFRHVTLEPGDSSIEVDKAVHNRTPVHEGGVAFIRRREP
jgi:hypothetical protein